ncbi:hypothetical protein FBDF15_12320 [Faecalibacterium duncaniae]
MCIGTVIIHDFRKIFNINPGFSDADVFGVVPQVEGNLQCVAILVNNITAFALRVKIKRFVWIIIAASSGIFLCHYDLVDDAFSLIALPLRNDGKLFFNAFTLRL